MSATARLCAAGRYGIKSDMAKWIREGSGGLLVLCSLGVLGLAVAHLRDQDYVAAVVLVTTGLSLLRAGVELLRPTVGE